MKVWEVLLIYFPQQQQIEDIQAGREDDKFVECRHISGHTYYYSGNAIKEVGSLITNFMNIVFKDKFRNLSI